MSADTIHEIFTRTLVASVLGDHASARRSLDELERSAANHTRARRTDDAALERLLLERDNYWCRLCGAPLAHVGHLEGLQRSLGADRFGSTHPVWASTRGVAVRVRGWRRARDPNGFVAACIPCRDRHRRWVGRVEGSDHQPARVDRPDWWPLLRAVDSGLDRPRAVVTNAWLLDGVTLTIFGTLVGVGSSPDVTMRVVSGERVEPAIVRTRAAGDGLVFHAHVDLFDAVVADPDRTWDIVVSTTDPDLRPVIVALPGFETTANCSLVDPIPPLPVVARRLAVDARTGLSVVPRPMGAIWDLASIEVRGAELRLRVRSVAHATDLPRRVWLWRRGEHPTAPRVLELDHCGDDTWALRADSLPSGLFEADESTIWNVWTSGTVGGEPLEERAHRAACDLREPRSTVRFPAVRGTVDGRMTVVRPYLTVSRHLAVKISPVVEAER